MIKRGLPFGVQITTFTTRQRWLLVLLLLLSKHQSVLSFFVPGPLPLSSSSSYCYYHHHHYQHHRHVISSTRAATISKSKSFTTRLNLLSTQEYTDLSLLTMSSQQGTKRQHHSKLNSSQNDNNAPKNRYSKKDNADDAVELSEVDARVLRSMLADQDKLNLDDEESLKNLLKRGVIKDIPSDSKQQQKVKNKESEFSSTVLQTLADTKFWKVFSRNAQDWLQSASIVIVNRIERDAKLLGAIGVFAWDRAVQDVKRAIPQSSSASKAFNTFFLSNTTTPTRRSNTVLGPLALPTNSSALSSKTIKADMTTTLDEIKLVTEGIRDIIKSSQDGMAPSSAASRRGLRTTAPAGFGTSTRKERLARAYLARQKKEKQDKNVIKATTKASFGLMDSAWELKRELEVEPNVPGYKTKPLRESAARTTRQLQASAVNILRSRGWEKAAALISAGSDKKPKKTLKEASPEQEETQDNVQDSTVVDIQDAVFVDATAETTGDQYDQQFQEYSVTEQTQEEEQQPKKSFWPFTGSEDDSPKIEDTVVESELTGDALIQRLRECLERPAMTWLQPSILAASDESIDNLMDRNLLEPIISKMIRSLDTLEKQGDANKEVETKYINSILKAASRTKSTTLQDCLKTQLCEINPDFSRFDTFVEEEDEGDNRPYFFFVANEIPTETEIDDENDIPPFSMEVDNSEKTKKPTPAAFPFAFAVGEVGDGTPGVEISGPNDGHSGKQQKTSSELPQTDNLDANSDFSMPQQQRKETVPQSKQSKNVEVISVAAEVVNVQTPSSKVNGASVTYVDVIPESTTINGAVGAELEDAYFATVMDDADMADGGATVDGPNKKVAVDTSLYMAEIVTDDDFETAVGAAKAVKAVEEDDGEEEEEPNPLIMLTLRALDVLFFVLEKIITVVIPNLLSLGGTVSSRLSDAKSEGMGSKGWKTLGNTKKGSKRY